MSIEAMKRTDRAHKRSSWAAKKTKSGVLAVHYGVSPSHARRLRTERQNGPLTTVCEMAADPNVDGAAIVAAVTGSYEDRAFDDADSSVLLDRFLQLACEEEHRLEAAQNRAMLLCGEHTPDALMDHASCLIEMATLKVRLLSRGVDVCVYLGRPAQARTHARSA